VPTQGIILAGSMLADEVLIRSAIYDYYFVFCLGLLGSSSDTDQWPKAFLLLRSNDGGIRWSVVMACRRRQPAFSLIPQQCQPI